MTRSVLFAALGLLAAAPAFAQSGFNFGPDVGPQVARGSAWVARADSPLATFFNPAALTRQRRSVHLGAHFMYMDRCFTRATSTGAVAAPGGGLASPGSASGPPAEVCMANEAFVNSQLGVAWPISDRLGLGVSVVGPHNVGRQRWPETVAGPAGLQPAATRFMLVDTDAILAYPTVSVGYALSDSFSVGGGFVFGFASEQASAFAEGYSPLPAAGRAAVDDFYLHQEVKLDAKGEDHFIPGFVAGALWSPRPTVDVGLWYHYSAPLKSSGSLRIESRYWLPSGARNTQPCGAGEPADCNITTMPVGGEINIPDELRGGVRYHRPRQAGGASTGDPLNDDVFDLEVDAEWANNSVVNGVILRPGPSPGQQVRGVSTPTEIPDEVEELKKWKDAVSLRVGGEYVVRQSRLAIQAGTFYESSGQRPEYLGTHFYLASKTGVSAGVTLRVIGRADLYAAVQRIVWADMDNQGNGVVTGFSMDPAAGNETRYTVNGGRARSSVNEVAVGVTVRF